MSRTDRPGDARTERRPGELTFVELLRWSWRQLTSMRTALILLLLLAVAAIPGSVVPQEGVDALNASRWKDDHPTLAPIYERLGLFDVYSSPWFAAIYLLLMVSLVGCIIPRSLVYWRGMRAEPPRAPRNLTRMPASASYTTAEDPETVRQRARATLRGRRYRVRGLDTPSPGGSAGSTSDEAVSAEKGYLREAGNLLFHLSLLIVLVGFAAGGLFGYQGGVILVQGNTFGNTLTQYDDFDPGGLFSPEQLDDFCFSVNDFDVDWLESGPSQGMARGFSADLAYSAPCANGEERSYDLRVNHPLQIGDTEIFLIGHGYAPVVTIRDGNGDVAYSGPTVFLPQDADQFSFGVIKAPDANPAQLGLEGFFYPTFLLVDQDGDGTRDPVNVMGDLRNPRLSLSVYTGDLGLDTGASQSVYVLDKSGTEPVPGEAGRPLRLDLGVGQTEELPDGLGSVTFDGVERWQRVQISQSPGKLVALGGVSLALVGLLGSLFIRPRRMWVRARRDRDGTLVEAAVLDRSGGGDPRAALETLLEDLDAPRPGTSGTSEETKS